ncbi:hypothetical protein NDU88_007930 [Pleurodeles waltl]|uniref:Uncharacterized protein n=1 Tax=Pleurodeles waltl TaxID=8319 RepID=A0AAV7QQC4_PLEWA|nr:hypothetical protein NDU88_007930 [Pleurodeles waltl]
MKTPAKKQEQTLGVAPEGKGPSCGKQVEEDTTIKLFLENLFGGLREDLASLRHEIATKAEELKREVVELEQRVDTVERNHDVQVVELDHHRQELLTLQDSNRELQFRLEDLKNRSRHSNICIRGVSAQATPGSLEDFVILFQHIAPAIKDQEMIIDLPHRAGHPSRAPGQAQDILTCLHYYKQKEQILAEVRDLNAINFEGHKIYLYQHLSLLTLQPRRALQPITSLLQEKGISYK